MIKTIKTLNPKPRERERVNSLSRKFKLFKILPIGLIILLIIQLTIGSILFLFPIKEAEAAGTTYYVDNCDVTGNDTNNGTSTSTPWLTINKVNTSSFSAGDSILFRRGCTWREQLTIPSSGTTGNPITFGAYGTGDDPIISGADLVTTWTQCNGSEYSDNFDDNDITDWTVVGSVAATGGKMVVTVSNGGSDYATSGAKTARTEYWAYFTVNLASSGLTWANSTLIGIGGLQAAAGSPRLQVHFANGTGTAYWRTDYQTDSGTTSATTATVATPDVTHEIVLHFKAATGAGNNDGVAQIWADGTALLNLSNVDSDTLTADRFRLGNIWANAGVNGAEYIDDAHLGTIACNPHVYSATDSTTVNIVREDLITSTSKATTFAGINGVKKFYTDGTNIYYRASDDADPDTHTMYVGTRSFAVNINNVDYIDFENIVFEFGNALGTGTVRIQGTSGNINLDHCTVRWSAKHGFYIDSTDSQYAIEYCDIHHNGLNGTSNGAGITFWSHTGAAVTKPILIAHNTVHHNFGTGIALETQYATAEYNTVYNNGDTSNAESGIKTHEGSGGGDGQHNIIRYNLIYNQIGGANDGNGIQTDVGSANNEIYYNVIYNCDGRCICIYDSTDISVYNNVCYGNGQNSSGALTTKSEIALSTSADITNNITVKNNIGYATVADTYAIYVDANTSGNTVTITNNDWYRASGNWYYWNITAGATLATWNGYAGVGTDINSNPSFVSVVTPDFSLQSFSLCINAGTNVGLTRDYAGNAVPECFNPLPDIGAYEYQHDCSGGGSPPAYSNPPIPGINGFRCIINNNDAKTTSRDVTLTLEAGYNVKYAAVSEKPDLSGAGFESFEPEVFIKPFTLSLGDGLKRVYAQFLTAYNRFSDIISDEIVLDTSPSVKPEEQAEVPKGPETTAITDGDLIRAVNSFDVYIVKILEGKKLKRLILNPDIFNQYGHLKWENIKEVSQEILDQYTTSDLVRALGDAKVHKLYANGDIGEKRWIKTLEDFLSFGYDWDAVYTINNYERDSYTNGLDLAKE